MHLIQAREEAKKMNVPKFHNIGFEILDAEARAQKCYWIDPFEGTFKIVGRNGFSIIDDFQVNDPQVINMKVENTYGNI